MNTASSTTNPAEGWLQTQRNSRQLSRSQERKARPSLKLGSAFSSQHLYVAVPGRLREVIGLLPAGWVYSFLSQSLDEFPCEG